MNRAGKTPIPKHVLTPRKAHSPAFKAIPFGVYQSRHPAFDWHRHGFYELMVVEKGSGTHEIDFINYAIEPGQFFVLHPNQVHRLQRADLLAGRVLIFDETLVAPDLRQSIFAHFYTLPNLPPSPSDYPALIASFTAIQTELARPDQSVPLLTSLLQSLFLQLLQARQLSSADPVGPSDFDYTLFVRFRRRLDQTSLPQVR